MQLYVFCSMQGRKEITVQPNFQHSNKLHHIEMNKFITAATNVQ